MALESLTLELDGKKIDILFDEKGFSIETDELLKTHEIHYLSAITFVYIGARNKGIVLDGGEILERAEQLYSDFNGKNYLNIPAIEELSLQQFNKVMKEQGL